MRFGSIRKLRYVRGVALLLTLLISFFAATGLVLALIGLYGVISFLVTQRTQEIGVRLALGADRSDILRLVMGQGLKLIGTGTALCLVAAVTTTRLLSSFLFGISSYDPVTFIIVTLLLVLVALLAALLPARSASRVDSMVALRWERHSSLKCRIMGMVKT